jgi:hypothetical protein
LLGLNLTTGEDGILDFEYSAKLFRLISVFI